MRKISQPYKRKDKTGWWVRWQENGKRITKSLPTKQLANHFRAIKYQQLNSDVFISAVDLGWDELFKEFMQRFELMGLSKSSKKIAERTLTRLHEKFKPRTSKAITQKMMDSYILYRKEQGVGPYTINKDIERLKTFVGWMVKNRYHPGGIELNKLKTASKIIKVPDTEKIRTLFRACPTKAWRVRILLSLVTGLRKSDIESLRTSDIDLKRATLDSQSLKTGKAYLGRPIPDAAIPELQGYIKSLSNGQVNLFNDSNVRKTWDKIRGQSGITRQDLRRTFSTLMQKIGSVNSAQDLLEHSDSRITSDYYTDQELILRWKVNQLPVKEWLEDEQNDQREM